MAEEQREEHLEDAPLLERPHVWRAPCAGLFGVRVYKDREPVPSWREQADGWWHLS